MSVNNGYVGENGRNGSVNPEYNGYSNGAYTHGSQDFEISETPKQITDTPTPDDDPEQAKRDKDPLFFCRWITKRPGLCFGKYLLFIKMLFMTYSFLMCTDTIILHFFEQYHT